ncbi:YggT family protein [Desulfosporosinus sp. BICA1-9]|uniref:YggT family protein n=1 Tax=Desulfosporosinus sp. BICA1-9 TaxID=1531958 RepID=UPI00054B3EB9|nr:YggT family protein [Desulfosporosinus sp. BICA1-9]KJS50132.1 MAG: hypothetical protein VR66_04620 [Peptococcaceae bacterium BRH_c23]KJS84506.1 MAG: hypothetical protein JL57_20420 [Desulfosporosinus sp. BICA1-9]HBW35013.1 YggT family protein [Desulfosporosinus sp.]
MSHDKGCLQVKSAVYYILGVLEVLLAFRFMFKLLAANPQNGFVSLIYSITNAFLDPFLGIFRTETVRMDNIKGILEPASIVGMMVFAVIAWGIVELIEVFRRNK